MAACTATQIQKRGKPTTCCGKTPEDKVRFFGILFIRVKQIIVARVISEHCHSVSPESGDNVADSMNIVFRQRTAAREVKAVVRQTIGNRIAAGTVATILPECGLPMHAVEKEARVNALLSQMRYKRVTAAP